MSLHGLFLDIASAEGCLATVEDGSLAFFQSLEGRVSDDVLIPLIESALKDSGWMYDDLTHIACVIGPGGFTSLRVAASFANTLIAQKEIKAAGIHLSDLYAARSEVDDFVWMHATKKESLFVRGFGAYAQTWPETTLLSVDNLHAELSYETPIAGELLDDQRERLRDLSLQDAPLSDIKTILPGLMAVASYGTDLLVPWYGRQG